METLTFAPKNGITEATRVRRKPLRGYGSLVKVLELSTFSEVVRLLRFQLARVLPDNHR